MQGFAAQIGFRVPNMIISPFTRKHYVSHTPMDHTAVIKFVESRFINSSAHLTNRDAAQPNLLEFFDFNAVPWSTPPTAADTGIDYVARLQSLPAREHGAVDRVTKGLPGGKRLPGSSRCLWYSKRRNGWG